LAAASSGLGDDEIYVSTNSGASWDITSAPTNEWTSIASSADGAKLVAADSGYGDGLIYISTDAGATWAATGQPGYWNSVASSADGTVRSAVSYPGGIYVLRQAPALSLTRSGTNLLISWQNLSAATGLELQQISNLAATNWAPVSVSPGLTNGWYESVVPESTSTNLFFRLAGP
jgi:hypothetical protein